MKSSKFNNAAVLAILTAFIGVILYAVGTNTDALTGEASHNAGYYLGVLALAVSGIAGIYAITGFAARQALIEYLTAKAAAEAELGD